MENVDPICELRDCLKKMGDDFVFIVGNGINKFLSTVPSWNKVLLNVAAKSNASELCGKQNCVVTGKKSSQCAFQDNLWNVRIVSAGFLRSLA